MADTKWLTQTQYDNLQSELTERVRVRRPEIAKLIGSARDEGDLKENGGYHAAREEQSMNEARITQLEHLLKEAKVGERPEDDGVVEPGMVVTANIAGEREVFLLGSREGGAVDLQIFTPDAPLGQAILGARVGDTVSYQAPNGAAISVEIIDCRPY